MLARWRRVHWLLLGVAFLAHGAMLGAQEAASSATAPHLKVELLANRPEADTTPIYLGIHFTLEPGWHVYWSNAGDSGEPPEVKWTTPAGYQVGPLLFPAPQRLPLGPLMDFGYEVDVLFPALLPLPAGVSGSGANKPLRFGAEVAWLVCRQSCIPGKARLGLSFPTHGDPALFTKWLARIPQPLPPGMTATFAPEGSGLLLGVRTGHAASAAQFFPLKGDVIRNAAPQPGHAIEKGVALQLTKDEGLQEIPKTLDGVIVLPDGAAYAISAAPGAVSPAVADSGGATPAIVRAIGLALVGGIILNLMPCVFPVLFIKALALVQSSQEERRTMRLHGLVYAAGILVSFWAVVALLLGLRAGGQHLGWGFQFQSPGFVAAIAMLLFFLGLSLAGMFEIGLSVTSAGSSLAARQGYAGSFFTGVLAMVVATPCTAPFMGAAIGFALAQSAAVTFAIFTALGLGLALPYLVLAFQPAWTRLLPRPGAWMEVLKQATAVPIFATVIWMVWLFAQSAGVNALAALLLAFLLLAVAGWVLGRWPAKGAATAVAVVLGVLAVALPLTAVRVLPGPEPEIGGTKTEGLAWEPFTPEVVARYQAQGRPVFVDFTASWCLSCQVNERVVLNRADVRARLRDSNVALVRADWTRHDEQIGRALEALGRNGVPAYALYPGTAGSAPKLLPEVLTTGIMFDALDGLRAADATRAVAGSPATR